MKAVLESLDGVDKALQSEYEKGDDGKYYLSLEGVENHPATKPLENAMRRTKEDLKKLAKERDDLRAHGEELEHEVNGLREGAIPKADVEALKKSYQAKYDKDIKERDDKLTRASATIEKQLIDNVAQSMATKIVAKPEYSEVVLPHIRGRLKLAYDSDGNAETTVLDKDGKPSALTLEDLEKEMLQRKAFAPILRGSHASGGSANGSDGRSSAAGHTSSKDFDMSKATPAEIVAHKKAQQGG